MLRIPIKQTLVMALMCALSACGGGSGGGQSGPAASAAPTPVVQTPEPAAQTPAPTTQTPVPAASASPAQNSATSTATIYPSYNVNPLPADATGMTRKAAELAVQMKLGWNIGNTMEAVGGETAWGNPLITSDLIRAVKANGFNAIRLPVAWDLHANQQTGEIDPQWLSRVRQVVQYCIDNDMYVIVNVHWDGGWLERNVNTTSQSAVNAKQKAYWEQIATKLRDFDDRLIFASANEPNAETAEQMTVLLSYHQTFVDAVRATGGRNAYRTLIVQGPNTDIDTTVKLWTGMPTDRVPDRQMVEVHFYSPYSFTLMTKDESWGAQAYYWGMGHHSTKDPVHNATWGEESYVDDEFAKLKSTFIDKGIPVVLGEFGAIRRDNLTGDALTEHLAARNYYYKYVVRQAHRTGVVPFMWDSGSQGADTFCVFNRNNYTVTDRPVLDAMLQGLSNQP